MKYHVYSHTLEIVFPKQVADELAEEFDKIQDRVQKRYAKQWIHMDSNQSFYIWRDVAMWFADQHWGVIVVEDWMEYHGWQYLYEHNGKRFQRAVNHGIREYCDDLCDYIFQLVRFSDACDACNACNFGSVGVD